MYNIKKTKELITRSTKIHNGKYTYPRFKYTKGQEKSIITCDVHGDFLQSPVEHLRGKGCRLCGFISSAKKNTLSWDNFKRKATKVHNGRYKYPINDYTNRRKRTSILCDDHGIFKQSPDSHLAGRGCPECKIISVRNVVMYTTAEFIELATEIHEGEYTYPRTDYKGEKEPVIITCEVHGDFVQKAGNHLRGHNCRLCANERIRLSVLSNTKDFISKATEIHGDNNSYDKVDYDHSKKEVIITCNIHGDFKQTPNDHLSGNSCPICKESRGERLIGSILIQENIKHEREYVLGRYRFRYDFYLPDHNLLIEFHGIQHYEPVEFFGGEEGYRSNVKRDIFKKHLAKENKIDIIYPGNSRKPLPLGGG